MCGIFGWALSASQRGTDIPGTAQALYAALAHRGPDDWGWMAFGYDGNPIGTEQDHRRLSEQSCALLLGQNRLSVIDLSSAGHQPMRSADGRYTLVYNGEIYNYLELRAELEQEGVRFCSHTDSEVLLHALIRWGTSCLTRLTGMFAFALHDAGERTLVLARDVFGIKPLYYHYGQAGLAFASELPALLEFPGIARQVAAQQAYSYLRFGKNSMGGETFLRNVFQVPPAHCLTFHLDAPRTPVPERYWKPDLAQRSTLSFADAAARLRELFLDSVRVHLRSDVPLGVALSGGIDSSAVTCAVRHLDPGAVLHTFSFIAKGSPMSEVHWIDMVAQHVGALRHTVEVEPAELPRDLDAMIRSQGEPFGSTSIYAQYRVFQLAKDAGVKVTLDGQGADELLAGYQGYPEQRMASLLLRGNVSGAWRFLRANADWPGRSQKVILRQTIRRFTPEWLIPFGLKLTGSNPTPAWLDIQALREQGVAFSTLDEREALYPSRDKVRQSLAYNLTWEGLQQLLHHGDRNAMAFSIESRVPFLTREMAEFCLSLPEDYLIDMNARSKSVFREAMRGIVPDAILDRRDKIGFETPEREWLTALAPWVETVLRGAENTPYLRLSTAFAEWRAIQSGQKPFDFRVWRWLNYIRWVGMFKVKA